MRVLVSACLLGENCKYNGGNNRNERVLNYIKDKEVIPVCPEILTILGTPRPSVEIAAGTRRGMTGSSFTVRGWKRPCPGSAG